MMKTELLKLNAAKKVDVGYLGLKLFELKIDEGFGHNLILFVTQDPGTLAIFTETSAPTTPDTELEEANRQGTGGYYINHANQSLHSVNFLSDIFAKKRALQIW